MAGGTAQWANLGQHWRRRGTCPTSTSPTAIYSQCSSSNIDPIHLAPLFPAYFHCIQHHTHHIIQVREINSSRSSYLSIVLSLWQSCCRTRVWDMNAWYLNTRLGAQT